MTLEKEKHWSTDAIAGLSRSIASLHRRVKVLLVEDDPQDLELMTLLLGVYPCDIICKKRRSDCAEYFAVHPAEIDLVFIDFKLGSESGLDIIKDARAKGLEMPFVIVTGYSDPNLVAQAMELGAVSVFVKPPTREQMETIFGNIAKS